MASEHSSPDTNVAVVMVPLPAQGHLNQLLHLSCRLASATSLPIHYIGTATHIRQAKLRAHGIRAQGITFHEFPTPLFENPQPNPHSSAQFPEHIYPSASATVTYLRGPVHALVDDLSKKHERVVIVYDSLMSYVMQDVDRIPNAESYRFWSISALMVYFLDWHARGRRTRPNLLGNVESILREIPGTDTLFPNMPSELRSNSKASVSGNIYNTSRALEGPFLDSLELGGKAAQKQWALGPFNPVEINSTERRPHECLDWLDRQEPDSVIFVSFGTTSCFTDEQIEEIALGLERSRHKFVWALRDADKGDIFRGEIREPVLPEGFEERVKGRGMVVREWAPQLEILANRGTGGFLSHCGWNSCMESMTMGVPVATWPVHSDQLVNAALLTNVLKVGIEVREWTCGPVVVPSGVVAEAIARLMGSGEGDEIRERAKELAISLRSSVAEGGVSHEEMKSFITHITRWK
ncbi:UDP-glycosyltransferase 73B3 [Striga hermonthica]|uniref:Glycosyltransferase n=1 Tax=Striga hermonthica TaxID=68872 RepID=A0A9N7NDE6_STRHE|nr:UDP-glycosyltransferase 73B3 [Striga hermonthica]